MFNLFRDWNVNIARYIRLYLYFLRFSWSKALEFRLDFFFRIGMDCVFYAVNIAFFKIIYLHTPNLAGWSEAQSMIFVSAFLLTDAIFMTVFANNVWWLPFFINRGDLDYYLTRPVSALFFLGMRDFAANSFFNLIIAGGIMIWAFSLYPEPIGVLKISIFIGLLLIGVILMFLMRILFTIPVFWTQSERGMANLLDGLVVLSERPHRIFNGFLKNILTTTLPFALYASFPCVFLFSKSFNYSIIIHTFAVVTCYYLFILFLWSRGLKSYSSASS